MIWTDQGLRVLLRVAVLLAVFAVGGVLGATLVGPGSVEAAHPCEESKCAGFWIYRHCKATDGKLTYCNGAGRKCVTSNCGRG